MARILIIDDNSEILDLLNLALSRNKHEVILSADGQDGLAKALAERPDLAIVDVMMPDMDGYELVRRIRANPRIAGMRIIILTARGQPVDESAALSAGADVYIKKPLNITNFLKEVEKLLGTAKGGKKAVIFPVFSLRGGIGKTTVATNLALLLQQLSPTLLLDLSPNSGHCALHLGLKPVRHWGRLVQLRADTLQGNTTIGNLFLAHTSGLKLMASPPNPLQGEGFSKEQMTTLLDTFCKRVHFIVVDMPPILNQAAQAVLEEAQRTILLSGVDHPGIQTTIQTLEVLKGQREQFLLLFNRVAPGPQPPLAALQRALRLPIAAIIPYDATQTTALHRQNPSALSNPQSPLVTALQTTIKQLLA
ncbi:MAG: response regulator [Chloroflexota bacterium]|nr:response regulator [Chloroflexota bacterium]